MAEHDPRLNLPKCDGAVEAGDFALPKSHAQPEGGDAAVASSGALQNTIVPAGEVRADAGAARAANDYTFAVEAAAASDDSALRAVRSSTQVADAAAKLDLPKSGLTY